MGAVTNALRWTLHVNLAWHTHSHRCNRPSVLSPQKVPNGMEARSRLLYIVSTFNPHLQSPPWIVCLEHARVAKKCLKKGSTPGKGLHTEKGNSCRCFLVACTWLLSSRQRLELSSSGKNYVALPFSGNNM